LAAKTISGKHLSGRDLKCRRCLGRSLNICNPLDEEGLAQLLRLGAPARWSKGKLLFRAGNQQGAFFKIAKGMVAVSRLLHDGRRQVLALRVPGDVTIANIGRHSP
jgi:CRP/FNR family transcriptional regulator